MPDLLKITRQNQIVTFTLNQPETRNALTGNTAAAEITQACADVTKDRSVRVVIITGAGPVFSSGGNVKDMRRFQTEAPDADAIREEYRNGIQQIPRALYALDIPTIAAVNGPAIGAGLDLATMCDIRIASDRASFAESFVKLGLVPGDGGAWFLPRAVGMSKACEMAFTGDALTAQQALECGLVSRVVPHDQLIEAAEALAARIAANPAGALRMAKRLLREGEMNSLASLLELSASYQAHAHQTAEHFEAVNAFIEKRPPNFAD